MVASGLLRERDLRALTVVIEDGLRDDPGEAMPWAALDRLQQLIPATMSGSTRSTCKDTRPFVAQGFSNADIARAQFISVATVAEHIFDRTEVRTRSAAALALPQVSAFAGLRPDRGDRKQCGCDGRASYLGPGAARLDAVLASRLP